MRPTLGHLLHCQPRIKPPEVWTRTIWARVQRSTNWANKWRMKIISSGMRPTLGRLLQSQPKNIQQIALYPKFSSFFIAINKKHPTNCIISQIFFIFRRIPKHPTNCIFSKIFFIFHRIQLETSNKLHYFRNFLHFSSHSTCRINPNINFKDLRISETAVYSATFWFHEQLANWANCQQHKRKTTTTTQRLTWQNWRRPIVGLIPKKIFFICH